jgi:molecular chaperone IbpA|tara:strand:+ start:10597 stop:11007 length:411 start_codon:yes stop_codon:yes gene_type:complete
MTHLDIFGQFRPFAIGFDRYFEDLERMSNITQTNYPPYNVVKEDDEHFSVELAVAGFSKKDVSITKEKNVLVIEGKVEDESKDFVHKGLASRAFKRSFTLADDVEISGASLKDGILVVSLERVVPEEDKPVSIKIS